MFLQRCFYIFIIWASTLSHFLETLPTPFLFLFREKRISCGVHRQSIFPLRLVSEKQHDVLMKTTRHFNENDTIFWWKQHDVFVQTTRRFFRSKKHSLYQGVDLYHFSMVQRVLTKRVLKRRFSSVFQGNHTTKFGQSPKIL